MKDSGFPPGHYYSPIPNTDELDFSRWHGVFSHLLRIDEPKCLECLDRVLAYAGELSDIEPLAENVFHWGNPMYPPADAITYYGMIRHLRPARVIEVGAGYSSLMALRALERNATGALSCVEPYPPSFLRQEGRISLIPEKIQRVPLTFFDGLRSGDVLFIDSSHQCKTQSDVNFILFDILPRLAAGVHVHFHDIFLPDEYPAFWLVEHGIFYNEQYVLLGFLANNPDFEIVLPNSYILTRHEELFTARVRELYSRHADIFRRNVPGAPPVIKGGAFWLRKQGEPR